MVKRFLVAFITGSFAIVAIEVSLTFVITVIASLNEWDSFAVGLGPVGIFSLVNGSPQLSEQRLF